MTPTPTTRCTAFEGSRRIASGDLPQVALQAKQVLDRGQRGPVLIFNDHTSQLIEVDFRGTAEDVVSRLSEAQRGHTPAMTNGETEPAGTNGQTPPAGQEAAAAIAPARRPGRPKLGVVGREVTLLPRHWDWLNSQPGGASVALRKLVEEARRINQGKDRIRQSQEAAYRFMSAMAGNEPGFEEATRALFARKEEMFNEMVDAWPIDLRDHAKKLAAAAFETEAKDRQDYRSH